MAARSVFLALALALLAPTPARAEVPAGHAEAQFAALRETRPDLARSMAARPEIEAWVLERFGLTEPPLYWDPAEPVSGRLAECDVGDSERAYVRVSVGAPGIDQLAHLIFELHNIQRYPEFEAVHQRAVAGDLDRDEYADRMLRIEFEAMLEARQFLRDHLADPTPTERERARTYWILINGTDSYEEHLEEQRGRGTDLLEFWRSLYDTVVIPEREAAEGS